MKNNKKHIITIPVTNEENNAFVGIRIRNDSVYFHYPESYDLSPLNDENMKDFRRDLIDIIRTISLAKSHSSISNKTNDSAAKTQNFALMSYLWIIRDYISNGLYQNSEKLFRLNGRGKVNWKKTLETQPIISNGNIIYNNLVVEVKNSCDNILTEAHKLCVYDSMQKIGWLFGMNEKSIHITNTTNSFKKKYISVIKAELLKTFDDVKKVRLNHMLKVLLGVDETNQSNEIVYGVDKYHYVYERMVDAVFSNVDDMEKFNPNARWFLKKNKYKPTEASSLRPDTIHIETEDKNAYVLDAKFYRFGATGNEKDLPSTTSIQKQITYGDHIIHNLRDKENIEKVHNAFVLPYNKNNNIFEFNENLEYIGYSKANWRENSGISHELIHAFLIDMKHLITVWSQGNCKDDIEKLILGIEKGIEASQKKNESL